MIEIYLLEQLQAFHECGTLSAASEKLHISQPALSRSMKKLEELINVTLFERQKNKLTLNENGLMAAEYARKILNQEEEMISHIRAFDRRRHTIALGSCAPAPVDHLRPILFQLYSEMTISSDVKSRDTLIRGLDEDIYQVIVLTEALEGDDYYCQPWIEEHLFVTLPPAHPLANYKELHLRDLNNETFLLYSKTGFWYDICMREMPDAHFLMQNEYDALGALVQASALPAFTTDLVRQIDSRHFNRVFIPLVDPDVNVTYHCICKKSQQHRLSGLFKQIEL